MLAALHDDRPSLLSLELIQNNSNKTLIFINNITLGQIQLPNVSLY